MLIAYVTNVERRFVACHICQAYDFPNNDSKGNIFSDIH